MIDQDEDERGKSDEDPNCISVIWALLLIPVIIAALCAGAFLRLLTG